jgi:hypothetical protein
MHKVLCHDYTQTIYFRIVQGEGNAKLGSRAERVYEQMQTARIALDGGMKVISHRVSADAATLL